jgi:hypothetical protein
MEILGTCGLICSQCPAYIAHNTNDDVLRGETAIEWSRLYGADIPASAIDCTGCRETGVKITHCEDCPVRLCAIVQQVATCAECDLYSCATLDKFVEFIPQAREKLEALRKK